MTYLFARSIHAIDTIDCCCSIFRELNFIFEVSSLVSPDPHAAVHEADPGDLARNERSGAAALCLECQAEQDLPCCRVGKPLTAPLFVRFLSKESSKRPSRSAHQADSVGKPLSESTRRTNWHALGLGG